MSGIKNGAPKKRRSGHLAMMRLSGANIYSLRAFAHAIWLSVESDLLAILQGLNAGSLERGDVNEYILCTAVWSDETKTFVLVEEFYDALSGHGEKSFSLDSFVVRTVGVRTVFPFSIQLLALRHVGQVE
jgi:hypothetical protein